MANNNAAWGAAPQAHDEYGLQMRSMGLKVHYTFDKDSQERCLARWPHNLQVQTVPMDEQNTIGVVDLRICLQAVVACSPELAGDGERDYTVYALDYSEPDTPLVGQGMLSWALGHHGPDAPGLQPQLLTGRVTKNLLAIFGNGAKETLEVKLKLTAVQKVQRSNPVPQPQPLPQHQPQPVQQQPPATTRPTRTLARSDSTMSENTEWHNLVQSNPGLGQQAVPSPMNSQPLAPAPAPSFNSSYDGRHELIAPAPRASQPPSASRPSSRPASVGPLSIEQQPQHQSISFVQGYPTISPRQSPAVEERQPSLPPQSVQPSKLAPQPSKPRSRPASRASSRPPTGRPRGRPRKKPATTEGHTSGYEDGTEGEDAPLRSKKRVKTTNVTQAERSNLATFGSAPESLRVAASTAGSLRSFRPLSTADNGPNGSHLHEGPRAPTPVPEARFLDHPSLKPMQSSNLRRQSSASQNTDVLPPPSFQDFNPSMTQSQDGRSPPDSAVLSPFSDEASPVDITSSPPVPRSAMFSTRSSPAPPSSPILPPMRVPRSQPDSGFMSGGLEECRTEDENLSKSTPPNADTKAVSKPKPKKSRAKKQPSPSFPPLDIHTENPGPPELLPKTSIYNPAKPPIRPKKAKNSKAPAVNEPKPQPQYELPPKTEPTQVSANATPCNELEAGDQQEKDQQLGKQAELRTEPHDGLQPEQREQLQPESHEEQQTLSQKGQHAQLQRKQLPQQQEQQQLLSQEKQQDCSQEKKQTQLQEEQQGPLTKTETGQTNFTALELALSSDYPNEQHQQLLNSLGLNDGDASLDLDSMFNAGQSFGETLSPRDDETPLHTQNDECSMEPPMPPVSVAEVSVEPELPTIPASDPILPGLTLPMPLPMSEPVHPQTDAPDALEVRNNKNYVKRQAIKQKLEEAVLAGQMPSFCTNCGALQTPTWRKIWKQLHQGVPEYHEYSDKPGHVTAINIIARDDEGKPTSYEMIKKSLGPTDHKNLWTEVLLCNPCGIWFSKWKSHRPQEKWEKDQARLSQTRKKRANGSGQSRSKKARTKSDAQLEPTSEAYIPTDPAGPTGMDGSQSPKEASSKTLNPDLLEKGSGKDRRRIAPETRQGSTHSQHSRGAGTPGSPITLDDELGTTRRKLFPSPRKEGEVKVLGELAINVVQTSTEFREAKDGRGGEKENSSSAVKVQNAGDDDFYDLFGTPPRPSTPPPKAMNTGPFKTPTRPTPSHRPVTRSVSKSMRSGNTLGSPSQLIEQTPTRTPSKTPRSSLRRRGLLPAGIVDGDSIITPMTRSIEQLLSEADNFVMPSPHRNFQLDMGLESDGHFDFSHLMSTDALMPSSPPLLRNLVHSGGPVTFGGSLTYDDGSANFWADYDAATRDAPDVGDTGVKPTQLAPESEHQHGC
ncbi:hypothetical protein F5Y15DRAFT_329041 [Xylariaceae sp. FL0016]|nr:hypothetical protein F5Y15DRAFT_329041 [Xylariaceae sp. FL0016]